MTVSNRGQMIDQALQRVGNNSASLKIQARYRLNRILQDLYMAYDWPFLLVATEVTIAATAEPRPVGAFEITRAFLKPQETDSLIITRANGQNVWKPIELVDADMFQRARASYAHASTSLPIMWVISYVGEGGGQGSATGLPRHGYTLPAPSEPMLAFLRYKALPADAPVSGQPTDTAYDEDLPLFPWDTFLSDALSEWAMAYEVDPRRAEQLQIDDERLARMRNATWPPRSFQSFVPLDPLIFSTPTWGSGRS